MAVADPRATQQGIRPLVFAEQIALLQPILSAETPVSLEARLAKLAARGVVTFDL